MNGLRVRWFYARGIRNDAISGEVVVDGRGYQVAMQIGTGCPTRHQAMREIRLILARDAAFDARLSA